MEIESRWQKYLGVTAEQLPAAIQQLERKLAERIQNPNIIGLIWQKDKINPQIPPEEYAAGIKILGHARLEDIGPPDEEQKDTAIQHAIQPLYPTSDPPLLETQVPWESQQAGRMAQTPPQHEPLIMAACPNCGFEGDSRNIWDPQEPCARCGFEAQKSQAMTIDDRIVALAELLKESYKKKYWQQLKEKQKQQQENPEEEPEEPEPQPEVNINSDTRKLVRSLLARHSENSSSNLDRSDLMVSDVSHSTDYTTEVILLAGGNFLGHMASTPAIKLGNILEYESVYVVVWSGGYQKREVPGWEKYRKNGDFEYWQVPLIEVIDYCAGLVDEHKYVGLLPWPAVWKAPEELALEGWQI